MNNKKLKIECYKQSIIFEYTIILPMKAFIETTASIIAIFAGYHTSQHIINKKIIYKDCQNASGNQKVYTSNFYRKLSHYGVDGILQSSQLKIGLSSVDIIDQEVDGAVQMFGIGLGDAIVDGTLEGHTFSKILATALLTPSKCTDTVLSGNDYRDLIVSTIMSLHNLNSLKYLIEYKKV